MVASAKTSGSQTYSGRLVTVSFGTGEFNAQTVVSDTSVTSNMRVIATILDPNEDESSSIDGITVNVINYIADTGYTVICYSPFGSVGDVLVYCQVLRLS
jgi:hypothetical protein